MSSRHASISLIERNLSIDPPICVLLCVWNKRYGGWTLPGGKIDEYESPADAQKRELWEETGLKTQEAILMYSAPTGEVALPDDKGGTVHLYRVTPFPGEPVAKEHEAPIGWFTHDYFLKVTPFREYFLRAFGRVK